MTTQVAKWAVRFKKTVTTFRRATSRFLALKSLSEMGDEESGTPYSWTSLEAPPEGSEEPLSGKFVKAAGR